MTTNTALSASGRARRSLLGALSVLALGACAQGLTLTPSDASTVLARRTITAPNPGVPGTFAYKKLYYGTGGDKNRAEYRDSLTYKTSSVDASPFISFDPKMAKDRSNYWGFDTKKFPRNARVWYPEGAGPFPLVLVVHGNHNMKEFSDPGYQWLGELLASRGFILASIDENFLNGSARGENDGRGWMLLKHLQSLKAMNDTAGKPLYHKIDMSRIALMGHSRGGEAVSIAGAFNRLPAYPDDANVKFDFGFDIKGLVAIAPVDGQYKPAEQWTPVADYNYLVIHGAHDGDVSSFGGLSQYNRLRYTKPDGGFKSAIWMYRANHGQWNTVWNNWDNGRTSGRHLQLDALIDGEEQRKFGRVVISAFLETTLHGSKDYVAMFRDHRAAGDWLPATMYQTRYQDASTRLLATFDEDIDVSTGTAPGVRIKGDSLSTWKETDVGMRARGSTFKTNSVQLGWNNNPVGKDTVTPRAPATFEISVPDSLRSAWSVGANSALLMTVGTTDVRPGPRKVAPDTTRKDTTKKDTAKATPKPKDAPKPKKPAKDSTPPDFSVEAEDAKGQTARVLLSTFGPVRMPIETYIYRRRGRDKAAFATLSEPVGTTYVMPMASFVAANSSFNPAQLRTVRLVFDKGKAGNITLDDVGIAKLDPK
ncbi:MAG: chlorophyllase/cutinase-like alpha/beta fold protein [Gemmatimonas sp.]